MKATVIPIQPAPTGAPSRERRRQGPKGRRVDPAVRAEVRALLGDGPLRRDHLIEYLHALNDRHGQLATPHLAALAEALGLAQAEVYEVASFYHHFSIVREDEQGRVSAPPRLTVRVCESLSCELAGAQDLLARLPTLLGADVRVIPAPCVGRCEQAPVVVVHQHPVAPGHAGCGAGGRAGWPYRARARAVHRPGWLSRARRLPTAAQCSRRPPHGR